jgi:LPS export ABC transporter protein LptC
MYLLNDIFFRFMKCKTVMRWSCKYYLQWVIYISVVILISSCENNIEVIKNLTSIKDIPAVSAQEMDILYSDSSKVRLKIQAKVLNKFNLPDKQYIEFPKGIILYRYDSSLQVTAIIQANYALYHENQKLWEAREDVVAKNLEKNEQLYTEELFWDQSKGIIYSSKFTKIINADGVFYGDGGFTSKEDMSYWKLIGIKGKVNIKDNDSTRTNH